MLLIATSREKKRYDDGQKNPVNILWVIENLTDIK